jgi:hypothetical protein
MQSNPYSPPASDIGAVPPAKDVALVTNTIAVLSVLPVLIVLAIPFMWEQILDGFSVRPAATWLGLGTAVLSVCSGGLLLALRPAAVVAYALVLAASLGKGLLTDDSLLTTLGWGSLYAAGLVYSVWLQRRGLLRSRPNNSSKPTRLGGAA